MTLISTYNLLVNKKTGGRTREIDVNKTIRGRKAHTVACRTEKISSLYKLNNLLGVIKNTQSGAKQEKL